MQLAKSRVAVLIGLLLAALLLALDTGFILVWRLFVVFALVMAVSVAWVLLLGVRGVQGCRSSLPLHLQAGDSFVQTLTLTTTGRLPRPALEVHVESECTGGHRTCLFGLPPHSVRRLAIEMQCPRRGRYRLGSFTVRGSDPLGVLSRRIVVGQQEERLVCPATVELPYFELAPRRRHTGSSAMLESRVSVGGVRDYVAGDSLSRVHWPTTARVGKLQVKEFDHDVSSRSLGNAWLVLDVATVPGAGDGQVCEFCVTVAASLLKRCLDLRYPTGLLVPGSDGVAIQPARGDDHRWQLLEALAVVRVGEGPPLHEMVPWRSGHFSADSAVVVVTGVADRRLVAPLGSLADRVGLVVMVVVGPAPHRLAGSSVLKDLAAVGVEVFTVQQDHDLAGALANSRFVRRGTVEPGDSVTPAVA
ncbi:MAG: DUF58 domain-containing protein [Chloroflexota bacterium]